MNISERDQLTAMRRVIAFSEGTHKDGQRTNDRGYDVLVGGNLFHSYADHPGIVVTLKDKRGNPVINKLTGTPLRSSAAGRYQMISATWRALKNRLKLKDFSPASQDAACNELLRECGSLALLRVGKFDDAIYAANRIWASLPGSPYKQRIEDIDKLRAIFKSAGGVIR